jgi:hypothetical protein
MKRATQTEVAQRINEAFTLLAKQMPPSEIVNRLISKYGISTMQAYRYVQQAKASQDLVLVPSTAGVFTIKLPLPLIRQVRKWARSEGLTISKVVSSALQDYLAGKSYGQTQEAS